MTVLLASLQYTLLFKNGRIVHRVIHTSLNERDELKKFFNINLHVGKCTAQNQKANLRLGWCLAFQSLLLYIWLPLFLNLSPLLNQRMIKECHRNVLVDFLHPEWTLQII